MKKTTFFKSKVLAFWLSLIMTVGIVVPVFAFSACPQREEEPLFALSSNATNRIFESEADRFALPRIITFEQDYTVSWAAVSNSIPSNPVAFLCESDTYSIGLIGAAHNTSRATTTFAATITSPNHPDAYTLNYTVSVTNISTDQLTHISSTKHGNINYTTRGIAQTRVFGLYDIVLPDCGTASPGHFEGEQWVDGTWRDVSFARSSSSFELLWNYRGQVNLDVWAEQRQADGTFIRITEANFSQSTSVARVIYDSEVSNSAIKVDFYNAGTVRIVAESAGQIRPGFRPRFEYIYNIVDAVNVYDFEDIKLLERIARYTYISDGIRGDDGQFLTRVNGTQLAGAAAFGRSLGHYIDIANYDGLLSLHFNTTATPTPNVMATPLQYRWDGFDDTGHFFDEFIHWSPAFRFKDIVLRSTHLDRTEAAIANGTMQSWAEGTWFFGSVFGNGFGIDASNYTQSTAGVYRNTHSMRGLDDGSSLGFEGRRFFPGYGWGETFAFYTLANNSIIDNIVLTGEEIPQGTTAIRLNQYSKLGVLGTSMLQGRDRPFSQGQTHDNGIFKDGQFIQGITVQNSVLEKGLTLLGFGYAPNADKPLSVLSSVFRFAGFTGVLGLSFGGGIGDADPENGEAVRTVAPEHSLSIRDNQRILHPQAAGSFGNFIVARNNIFHDISVSPFLTMPSRSGSHISIEGEQNYFFSWLRSNDIQFPEMPNPLHEGFARIMGGSINGMIPALMNRVFTNNNNQGPPAAGRGHSFPQGRTWHQTLEARYEQPNGVFLINVPVIIVTDEGQTKNNFVTFDHALLNPALITAAGLVSDHAGTNTPRDLNQRFDLLMLRSPLNAEPSLQNHLIRVSDMNSVGINRRIASIVPAGQNVPTIA
ncbi:MAG: hypothetical protein FWD86_03765, partial [Firmicutes bacterium]|nr:hypothetical protein [Bacillota bacterium]